MLRVCTLPLLLSGSCLGELRRVTREVPDQRHVTRELHRVVDLKLDQALRTAEGRLLPWPVPEYLASARELQRVATVEVQEQQPAARVGENVPERVKEKIAAVVGKEESVRLPNLDKPRAPA